MVIQDDEFIMVRKHGKEIWTSLGGKLEPGETEAQALAREIMEEVGCDSRIIKKIGDFEAPAIFDDATLKLSVFLTELVGAPKLQDSEIAEVQFVGKDYFEAGIKLTEVITNHVIPVCKREGLLKW